MSSVFNKNSFCIDDAEILIDKRSREFFQLLFRNLSLLIQIFIIKIKFGLLHGYHFETNVVGYRFDDLMSVFRWRFFW